MASKIPKISRVNYMAIAAMEDGDIFKTREYYIVVLVKARRINCSDTLEDCINWIVALTAEMRLRGSDGVVRVEDQPMIATA